MEFANALLQLVNNLWGLASRPLGYICNLTDNVNSLRNTTNQLKAKSETVLARVEREERGVDVERTAEVAYWLNTVQELVDQVEQIPREAGECDQIKCLSRCLPSNCWSSYKLGKRVDQMLNEVRELQAKEFEVVTSTLPPPPVLDMPMDETVGLDISKSNEVWKWLVDEKQVGVIGLYGTGGVGKTTLMRRIEKELSRANNGFDVVIWVVVSKPVNQDKIQDTIRRRLGIEDGHWERRSREDRAYCLCQALTRKKFVLLLDDLWARLDLSKIGVPHLGLENGSKVVLTTRLKHVCDHMGADKTSLEVQCLMPKEALELFEKNVGKSLVDCHQEIRDLAKDIAEECKGLPLALITVGRAMARKDNPGEWRHALTTLRNKPHNLQGMVEEVYHILEFSYDSLDDSTRQACFLYCCLFPEDYPIITNQLIELWIGEGLLGDTDDVYGMQDKGESILGDLNRACLLESGGDGDRRYVKMHDVIRDMATWIARDHGQRENKLLVIQKNEDMSAEMISKWGEAKKVSIWGKWIWNINQIPSRCSQLETLFVRETSVTVLPSGFFDSMTACLTVLDLSNNEYIESFPEGICSLINLQYLNLSATGIRVLPKEIKNLTRLRWLLMDNMMERNIPLDDVLERKFLIPTGAITSLPLNVLSLWESGNIIQVCYLVEEEEMVEELGCMQHLIDLSICVRRSSSAQKIFQSPNLRRCIRRVSIDLMDGNLTSIVISYSPASIDAFSHLETLYLFGCTELREMNITQGIGRVPNWSCFPNLVQVLINSCKLLDLSWLVHAPKLRKLTVVSGYLMERIIGDGFAREELDALGLFSRLELLYLYNLPKLTSICDQTLSFAQGVRFHIDACPGLKKLPLDSSSERGSFEVTAGKTWWTRFEWDPTAPVTLELDVVGGPVEEMTFGEAASKAQDESQHWTTIRFLARGGPSN